VKLKLRKRLTNVGLGLAAGAGELGYRMEISRYGDFDVAYRTGTADVSTIAHSFDNDIFYTGVPEYRPSPTDVIIDVGAHIGTFAMLSARLAPQGRVIAIEASRETFNYLRVNLALNRLDNATPLHLALSDKRGTVRLHHDRKNWGHSIMQPLSRRGESVPTASLADVMADQGLARVDFIKFNCEGAEFPILLATPKDVLARVARMVVLYHSDLATTYRFEDLTGHLEASGFKLSIRNPELGGKRGWIYADRS
jgi:FkbM family methyltransferase